MPRGAERAINRFFQARYGLFTCQDSQDNYGGISVDPLLIRKWETTDAQLRRTWTLAILSALSEGDIKIEQLGQYRHTFKESKKFVKYLKSHPNHYQRLNEQKNIESEKSNLKYKKERERRDFNNFNTDFMRQWI